MLSNDPNFTNLSIPDLSHTFDTQQQNALMTAEQYKNLASLLNPANNIALQQQAAQAQANRPQLQIGVDKADPGTMLGQGLSGGINNYMAMRNYGDQRQAYRDMAASYQQAQQRQIDLANKYIEGQQGQRQTENQNIPVLLGPKATPAQIEAARVANLSTGGAYYTDLAKTAGTNLQSNANITPKQEAQNAADQAKLNWQRERFHALTGVFPEQVFAQGNQGQLTPQIQSAWKYVYDSEPPKDLNDFQQRVLDLQGKKETVQGQATDNQTRGPRNAATLDSQLLQNSIQQVNLKYADTLKKLDQLTAQGNYDDAQRLRDHIDKGKAAYDRAVQNYDHLTPGEISLFNSQNKSLGLPYELPAKPELKPVPKGGLKEMYDPTTGVVVPVGVKK